MQPNRLCRLQVAEYTSFAASVLGVVISTASRQVVYAAAPLSLSVFLNLLNRQRFEQQTQQSLIAIRAEVEQQSQLHQAFSHLKQEVTSTSQQLSELDAKVTCEQQVRLDLWTANTQLEERLSQLTQSICDDMQLIRQQIPSEASILNRVATQLLESFPSAEQVDSLKTEVDSLQKRFEQQTQQSLIAIRAEVEQQSQLQQTFSDLKQEVTSTSQQLSELDAKVTCEQQVRLDLWTANTQLEERLSQLTQSICDDMQLIRQQIPSEASILNCVATQLLESFPSVEQVDSLKTEVDSLQIDSSQLLSVQQQQNKLQAELAQLQALIKQLQERIGNEQDSDEEDAELELELLAM